jgi:hypothetical protein
MVVDGERRAGVWEGGEARRSGGGATGVAAAHRVRWGIRRAWGPSVRAGGRGGQDHGGGVALTSFLGVER